MSSISAITSGQSLQEVETPLKPKNKFLTTLNNIQEDLATTAQKIKDKFEKKDEQVIEHPIAPELSPNEIESFALLARVISLANTPELIRDQAEFEAICARVEKEDLSADSPLKLPFLRFQKAMSARFKAQGKTIKIVETNKIIPPILRDGSDCDEGWTAL